jgi:hypothetical protein
MNRHSTTASTDTSADDGHLPVRTVAPTFSGTRAQLEHEWVRICRRPANVRRARGWQITDIEFSSLDELLALAGAGSAGPEQELVLRRLLETAAGDDLAARVFLQRMLPILLRANHRRPHGMTSAAGIDELLGAAWIAIRTFDRRRQPSCLVPALVHDAVYRAFLVETRRRDLRREIVVERLEHHADHGTDRERTLAELRLLLLEAQQAGLPPVDLEVLRRVIMTGSTERVAAELGVTPRAVRYRCTNIAAELAVIARAA